MYRINELSTKHIYMSDCEKEKYDEYTEVIEICGTKNTRGSAFRIYLDSKELRCFPEELRKLRKLCHIDVSKNRIKNIPDWISEFENLATLTANSNALKSIPECVYLLKELWALHVGGNRITQLSNSIGQLERLKELSIQDNNLTSLPESIGQLKNLKILCCSRNNITELPESLWDLKLDKLCADGNSIPHISPLVGNMTSLVALNVSKNKITQIPDSIGKLENVVALSFKENLITTIPSSLMNCKALTTFYINDNPIEHVQQSVKRFLNKLSFTGKRIYSIYNDSQNIHTLSIQDSVKKSVDNLLKINTFSYELNYTENTVLLPKTISLLTEYCADKSLYAQLDITFEELLTQVMCHIESFDKETQIQLYNRINEEMEESECRCPYGRIVRLVNSLNGISPLVEIQISESEDIGNIISYARSRYGNDIEKQKKYVTEIMTSRKYSEELIDEWMSYIE